MDFFVLVSVCLTDDHILELSKRISTKEQLMDFGIKVLKHRKDAITRALSDNQEKLQPATHELLSGWREKQSSQQKAYVTLHAGLKKCEMNQLAAELKRWVEGTTAEIERTLEERK